MRLDGGRNARERKGLDIVINGVENGTLKGAIGCILISPQPNPGTVQSFTANGPGLTWSVEKMKYKRDRRTRVSSYQQA